MKKLISLFVFATLFSCNTSAQKKETNKQEVYKSGAKLYEVYKSEGEYKSSPLNWSGLGYSSSLLLLLLDEHAKANIVNNKIHNLITDSFLIIYVNISKKPVHQQ